MEYSVGDEVIAGKNNIGHSKYVGRKGIILKVSDTYEFPYKVRFAPDLDIWSKVETRYDVEKCVVTKDSGKRVKYASGFQRDTNEGKPRYDLIPVEMLTRMAELYQRGAIKYEENNWKLAKTPVEIERFKESAWRHFVAWVSGETDEDHMAAACFNMFAYEWHTKNKNG